MTAPDERRCPMCAADWPQVPHEKRCRSFHIERSERCDLWLDHGLVHQARRGLLLWRDDPEISAYLQDTETR